MNNNYKKFITVEVPDGNELTMTIPLGMHALENLKEFLRLVGMKEGTYIKLEETREEYEHNPHIRRELTRYHVSTDKKLNLTFFVVYQDFAPIEAHYTDTDAYYAIIQKIHETKIAHENTKTRAT